MTGMERLITRTEKKQSRLLNLKKQRKKYCNGKESKGIEQFLEIINNMEEDGRKLHGKKDDQGAILTTC